MQRARPLLSPCRGALLRQGVQRCSARPLATKSKPMEGDGLLLRITGEDRPGVTAEFAGMLQGRGVDLLDIDQALVHENLALYVILRLPEASGSGVGLLREVLRSARDMGVSVDFDLVDMDHLIEQRNVSGKTALAVTVMHQELDFGMLAEAARAASANHYNIIKIERLSPLASMMNPGEVSAVELVLEAREGAREALLRKAMYTIQKRLGCDMAVMREGLARRSKRLIVMDMDSTLIQEEVIDEIARSHGVYKAVAAVTQSAMNGEMDFDDALRERCRQLKGCPVSVMDEVYTRINLTPGATEFIAAVKSVGCRTAVVSGGFTVLTDRIQKDLGLDYAFANQLEVVDGLLTGEVVGPIVNRQRKADLLESLAKTERIGVGQVIAVGDGANDLDMIGRAGLGIAFNAKPAVQLQAEYKINHRRLDSILYLIGVRPKDLPSWSIDTFT